MSQQFITRVVNYVANEVIIKGLSNSRTFQKFAVRTNKQYEELNKQGTDKLTKTLEEMITKSATAEGDSLSATVSAANGSKTKMKNALLKPPQRPLRGIPGFFLAFFKEVRKDLGGGVSGKM
mmetsp:Transcript_25281/g.28285  ORF Transcript_25281/g.28285 Transcript_25281/m.28285 type:complete len:122 (-) Transcript_25281:61-426(-)